MQKRLTMDASAQSHTIHDRENSLRLSPGQDRIVISDGPRYASIVFSGNITRGNKIPGNAHTASRPPEDVLSGFTPAYMASSIAVAAARHLRDLPGPPADRSPVIPGINPGTWQSPSRSPPGKPPGTNRRSRLHHYRTGYEVIVIRARAGRRYPRPGGTHEIPPGRSAV
jgi:hypothetical protein